MWLCSSCFFFCKQKTAYELRISDWSSDVCSSDLWPCSSADFCLSGASGSAKPPPAGSSLAAMNSSSSITCRPCSGVHSSPSRPGTSSRKVSRQRSEEHTSELQSLMRISYAVFCLKKKKNDTSDTNTTCKSSLQ